MEKLKKLMSILSIDELIEIRNAADNEISARNEKPVETTRKEGEKIIKEGVKITQSDRKEMASNAGMSVDDLPF